MRVIVFFDLPMVAKQDRIQYAKFRKHLQGQGFVMIQQSVYCKIALNNSAAEAITNNLRMNRPKKGNIQVMKISERQYQNIEFLVGEGQKETIDSNDRLIRI